MLRLFRIITESWSDVILKIKSIICNYMPWFWLHTAVGRALIGPLDDLQITHVSNLDRIPELSDELLDLFFHEVKVDSDDDGGDSLVAIGIVPHTPEIHFIKSSFTKLISSLKRFTFVVVTLVTRQLSPQDWFAFWCRATCFWVAPILKCDTHSDISDCKRRTAYRVEQTFLCNKLYDIIMCWFADLSLRIWNSSLMEPYL